MIEVHSRVPFSPDVQPDDLIIKAEYADFLERTRLDELVPGVDLSVSAPGQYDVLLEHIEIHCCLMGKNAECDASEADVVLHWYNEAYWPVVQVIREQGLLRDFPGRTETDLYLWLSEHRASVEKELGWTLTPESAALSLAEQFAPRRGRFVSRVGRRIINVITPDELKAGPEPGRWRRENLSARRDDRLFADILVSINGDEASWHAMEQALEITRREGAQLHGLHVAPAESDTASEPVLSVQAEFNRRCEAAGVPGTLAIEAGEVARSVIERSRWTDLVVLSLEHPPAPQLMARLASGFRTILQQCPRPVLAVPHEAPFPESALLAYDGSRKADEALFVAAYLSGQWKLPLVVVTVIESGRATSDTQTRAQSYLESHEVQAAYVKASGPVAEAILRTADEHPSGLIIMGGYGFTPVLEVMLGSAVDQVLRESRRTMLICR